MPADDAPITRLVLDSTPVAVDNAVLHRTQKALPTGLLGSEEWKVELAETTLPTSEVDARVELTADGIDYSGAARAVTGEHTQAGRTTLVGTGPLISYDEAPSDQR